MNENVNSFLRCKRNNPGPAVMEYDLLKEKHLGYLLFFAWLDNWDPQMDFLFTGRPILGFVFNFPNHRLGISELRLKI